MFLSRPFFPHFRFDFEASSQALSLKPQFSQDLIRHVLVLPRPARQALELDPMQAQQRNLDDEDLELEDHAAAQLALNMRACFPNRSRGRASVMPIDAFIRGIGIGETIFLAGTVLIPARRPWCLRRLFGFTEVLPLPVEAVAVATAHEAAEADSPFVAWGLVPVATGREIDDFLQVDGRGVSAGEAAADLRVFYAQLLEDSNYVGSDHLDWLCGCC